MINREDYYEITSGASMPVYLEPEFSRELMIDSLIDRRRRAARAAMLIKEGLNLSDNLATVNGNGSHKEKTPSAI